MSIEDRLAAIGILCCVVFGTFFSYILFVDGATWFFDVMLAVPGFISYESYRPALVGFIGLNSLVIRYWAIPAKKNSTESTLPKISIVLLGFSSLVSIGFMTRMVFGGHSLGNSGLYAVYLATITGTLLLIIEPYVSRLDAQLSNLIRSLR